MRLLSIRPWCQLAPIQAWLPKMRWKHKHMCDHKPQTRGNLTWQSQTAIHPRNSGSRPCFDETGVVLKGDGRPTWKFPMIRTTWFNEVCLNSKITNSTDWAWPKIPDIANRMTGIAFQDPNPTSMIFSVLGSHHTEASVTTSLIAKSVEYVPSLPRTAERSWMTPPQVSYVCHFLGSTCFPNKSCILGSLQRHTCMAKQSCDSLTWHFQTSAHSCT